VDDGEPVGEAAVTKPGKPALAIGLGLALCAGTALLVTTLENGCSGGKTVVQSYVATVRAGAPVTPAMAGTEATTLTALLRSSRVVSIGNFQAQRGTACFWVTLSNDATSSKVRFVLDTDAHRVLALSSRRECDCPIDADLPCRLVD
jgi:hypothetical protein